MAHLRYPSLMEILFVLAIFLPVIYSYLLRQYQEEEKAEDILNKNPDVVEKYQRMSGDVDSRVQACIAELAQRQNWLLARWDLKGVFVTAQYQMLKERLEVIFSHHFSSN